MKKNINSVPLILLFVASPLLYLPGFGNWVREPKYIFVYLLAGLSSFLYRKQSGFKLERLEPSAVWWVRLLILLLVCQVTSAWNVINNGYFLLALGQTLCLLVLTVNLAASQFKPSVYHSAFFYAAAIVAAIAGVEVYFGFSIFDRSLFLGLPVGGRNYLPIFLSLCVPGSLNFVVDRIEKNKFKGIIGFLILILIFTMALAFRTRTVWLALGLQFSALGFMFFRTRFDAIWKKRVGLFSSVFLVSILMVGYLPNHLKWISKNPYTESLAKLGQPEASNGRSELWPVVLDIAMHNATLGIGAGQYAVKSRQLIAAVQPSHPEVFSFLTSDSPAFNDYLQSAAELGFAGGIVFLAIYFFFPLALFVRAAKYHPDRYFEILIIISSLTLGVCAFFTNSFDRSEQILVLAVNYGFLFGTSVALPGPGTYRFIGMISLLRKLAPILLLSLSFLIILRFSMSPHPLKHFPYWKTSILYHPKWAHSIWPWDKYWNQYDNSKDLIYNLNSNGSEDFFAERNRLFPANPEVGLMQARVFEKQKDISKALDAFKTALVELPNGKCRKQIFMEFRSFLNRHQMSLDHLLDGSGASHCASQIFKDLESVENEAQ